VLSISPVGDTILWLGRQQDAVFTGSYLITGGAFIGQGGRWAVRQASAQGFVSASPPDVALRDWLTQQLRVVEERTPAPIPAQVSPVASSGAASESSPPSDAVWRPTDVLALAAFVLVLAGGTWLLFVRKGGARRDPGPAGGREAEPQPGGLSAPATDEPPFLAKFSAHSRDRLQRTRVDTPQGEVKSLAATRDDRNDSPVLDWVSRNAFRVLGLSASAPLSAIYEADEATRRAAKLGTVRKTPWDLDFCGIVGRSEVAARDAVGRLTDPIQRLNERLLWVHDPGAIRHATPQTIAQLATRTSGPFASHDAAFFKLLSVCLTDPGFSEREPWIDALASWKSALENDEYWAALIDLEMDGGFEPMAEVTDIRSVRAQAAKAVAEIPSGVARAALAAGKNALARRALQVLALSKLDESLVDDAQSDALRHVVEQLEGRCTAIGDECRGKVERRHGAVIVAANRAACEKAVARFDAEVQPRISEIFAMVGADSEVSRGPREMAANCLMRIAIDITWANDFERATELLERAGVLAEGTALNARIQTEIAEVRETAKSLSAHVATVDVNKKQLKVYRDRISFGEQSMQLAEVGWIRFGIFKSYRNGIRTSQSYCIWMTNGQGTMEIECAKGWFVGDGEIQSRWQQALDALWTVVISRLMLGLVEELRTGRGFTVGRVKFDEKGIHKTSGFSSVDRFLWKTWVGIFGGESVEIREHKALHADWKDVSFGSANGAVNLYNQKRLFVSLSLRDEWNAVLIDPLLSYLWKEGRLWDVVAGRAPR
jgi:hypothetical protein